MERTMRNTILASLVALMGLAAPAMAQSSQFAPRLLVDDKIITNYEYNQRFAFMTLLNAPGDLRKEAERTLIEDRLRFIAADRLKIRLTPAQIEAGMAEFSGRFELPVEEFITIIEQNGIARQTFRDFVHAGLVWREVARAKFGPQAQTLANQADVDRALSTLAIPAITRVQMSEIRLPLSEQHLARELAAKATSDGAFAAAARQHSTADTAAQGGRLDWVAVTSLEPQVSAALEAAGPGKTTEPVRLTSHWAIYRLHRIDADRKVTPQITAVDYAMLMVPGAGTPEAAAQLADIVARTDRCNDLNRWAKGQPEGTLRRETVLQTALPRDLAAELETLDDNEISTRLVRGGNQMVLMLCSRRVQSALPPANEAVRGRLVEARFGAKADIYLQELRANAHIRRP